MMAAYIILNDFFFMAVVCELLLLYVVHVYCIPNAQIFENI